MKHYLTAFVAAACLLLAAAADARADLIGWSEFVLASPQWVHANGNDAGGVHLTTSLAPHHHDGSADFTAVTLRTATDAGAGHPDHFTDRPYSFIVLVRDRESGILGAATFSGAFNGTLSGTTAAITNTWTSPTTQTLHLGHHLYDISITQFAAPSTPGSDPGFIRLKVNVHHNPEPGSLLLAAFALPAAGLAWRRRRAKPAA
jgi:hypothetical protein